MLGGKYVGLESSFQISISTKMFAILCNWPLAVAATPAEQAILAFLNSQTQVPFTFYRNNPPCPINNEILMCDEMQLNESHSLIVYGIANLQRNTVFPGYFPQNVFNLGQSLFTLLSILLG